MIDMEGRKGISTFPWMVSLIKKTKQIFGYNRINISSNK